MEQAIFYLAESMAQSNSAIASLLWMAFVGFLVLLPSLGFPLCSSRYGRVFAPHIVGLGFVPILFISGAPILRIFFPRFVKRHFGHFSSAPFLHIVALGLVAIWCWLQILQEHQKEAETNVADINRKTRPRRFDYVHPPRFVAHTFARADH